jgi:putative addiction module component (TIGR02574 family)
MTTQLSLDKMTVSEKLNMIEEIWADLSRAPESIPSPDWHINELEHRERLIREGSSSYLPLDEAKQVIRNRIR